MAQIAEDYVSPSVRWGVLKQDYPEAVAEFSETTGIELGIPAKFGGEDQYCVAQILLRPTDESPIVGYKPFSDAKSNKNDHPSDAWNILCTKALGRALKRAGYADTAGEMKLIVQYKQRNAEHYAIRGGSSPDVDHEHVVEGLTEKLGVEAMEVTGDIGGLPTTDDWHSDDEMNKCHAELKEMVSGLPPGYADSAREAHQKLNGRQWPILKVSQWNSIFNTVAALHAEAAAEMAE
jgi:hypothetical protein